VKTCACGRHYTPEQWATLPYVGRSTMAGLDLELRNCRCGSTITVDAKRLDHKEK
jgi:hypothetical protein